jgi:hypothetical protein
MADLLAIYLFLSQFHVYAHRACAYFISGRGYRVEFLHRSRQCFVTQATRNDNLVLLSIIGCVNWDLQQVCSIETKKRTGFLER